MLSFGQVNLRSAKFSFHTVRLIHFDASEIIVNAFTGRSRHCFATDRTCYFVIECKSGWLEISSLFT